VTTSGQGVGGRRWGSGSWRRLRRRRRCRLPQWVVAEVTDGVVGAEGEVAGVRGAGGSVA
jgi:hypothetical protein